MQYVRNMYEHDSSTATHNILKPDTCKITQSECPSLLFHDKPATCSEF